MEAMTCGLPVVCSRIRGNIDLIDENGGFLINSNDPDLYVRAISRLVDNKEVAAKMSRQNKDRVQKCSVEAVIDSMKKIYKV
jgi:glycosyltransferase involved in cell wall biosynthesis